MYSLPARSLTSSKTAARLHKHPLKSAGFKVLLAPMPSALVELGYMSTKDDLRQLTSASWRAKTAQAHRQSTTFLPLQACRLPVEARLTWASGLSFNIKPGNHRILRPVGLVMAGVAPL